MTPEATPGRQQHARRIGAILRARADAEVGRGRVAGLPWAIEATARLLELGVPVNVAARAGGHLIGPGDRGLEVPGAARERMARALATWARRGDSPRVLAIREAVAIGALPVDFDSSDATVDDPAPQVLRRFSPAGARHLERFAARIGTTPEDAAWQLGAGTRLAALWLELSE